MLDPKIIAEMKAELLEDLAQNPLTDQEDRELACARLGITMDELDALIGPPKGA